MKLELESRLPRLLPWPCWLWMFVAVETFFLLWVRVVCGPPGPLVGHHFRVRSVLFGATEGQLGALRALLLVNLVLVLGLWVACRSGRTLDRRQAVPLVVVTVAGALVLATCSWLVVQLIQGFPGYEVDAVLRLDGSGEYTRSVP